MPISYSTERSSSRRYSERIEAQGDPTGPLAGQIWVCTGDFSSGEAELVRLATSLGCDVKERFGKKATILVVGQRNPDHFCGKEKSKKLLDAEAALAAGRKVHIMTEREFIELARYYLGRASLLSKAS
jgi:NAD-dependent DNA ligase